MYCVLIFTDKVCKNNAHAHATSSRPPSFPRGLWWRLLQLMQLTSKTVSGTKQRPLTG